MQLEILLFDGRYSIAVDSNSGDTGWLMDMKIHNPFTGMMGVCIAYFEKSDNGFWKSYSIIRESESDGRSEREISSSKEKIGCIVGLWLWKRRITSLHTQ